MTEAKNKPAEQRVAAVGATPAFSVVSGLAIPKLEELKPDENLELNRPLDLNVPDNITLEINDIVYIEATEKRQALLGYLRSNVLRSFNCIELGKTAVQTGRMYFNGNVTKLKMPKVKVLTNGKYAETPAQYAKRTRAIMAMWLIQSQQNAYITEADVMALFNDIEEQSLQEQVADVEKVLA